MVEVFDVLIESSSRLVIIDSTSNADLLLSPDYLKNMENRFHRPVVG